VEKVKLSNTKTLFSNVKKFKITGDNIFKVIAAVIAASAIVILLLTGFVLAEGSVPVLREFGLSFFY